METERGIRKVIVARSRLILTEVFFEPLVMKLTLVEDSKAKKMWTDGISVGVNPDWASEASLDEITARLCEITMHNANGHGWRMSGRDPADWNKAADYSLWSLLKNAGYALPTDVFHDARFDGKSPEFIYNEIHVEPPPSQSPTPQPQEQPESEQGQDEQQNEGDGDQSEPGDNSGKGEPEPEEQQESDPGSDGEIRPPPVNVDRDELANEWQQAVLQAANAAQAQGRLPAGMERLVEQIKHPKIPWQEELRKIVQQIIAKADFSWRRPNKRYVTQGIYMPEIRSERMPAGVVYWDTSGSMDDQKTRAKCAGETVSIIDECRPERLFLIYGDAKVQHVDEFEPGDPVVFHPKGGGGTDFQPIFKYIEDHDLDPAFFIGITDLYGTFPTKAPEDYPVIWCATTSAAAPFGEILRLPANE